MSNLVDCITSVFLGMTLGFTICNIIMWIDNRKK